MTMTDRETLAALLEALGLGVLLGFLLGEINAMRRARKYREELDRIGRGFGSYFYASPKSLEKIQLGGLPQTPEGQ